MTWKPTGDTIGGILEWISIFFGGILEQILEEILHKSSEKFLREFSEKFLKAFLDKYNYILDEIFQSIHGGTSKYSRINSLKKFQTIFLKVQWQIYQKVSLEELLRKSLVEFWNGFVWGSSEQLLKEICEGFSGVVLMGGNLRRIT